MTSGEDRARNLETALRLVGEAADLGAKLVGLPENFAFMGPEEARLAGAETLEGPTLSAVRELAARRHVHVLAGSIAERIDDPRRTANTSVLVGDDGSLAGRLPQDPPLRRRPSRTARATPSRRASAPGTRSSLAATRAGPDRPPDLLRPALPRALPAAGGARARELLTIPSAFTLYTGKDHWEVLVRARAIENLAYVLAPAQVGRHGPRRETFGNAMIVDPWGVVLARCPDGEGVVRGPLPARPAGAGADGAAGAEAPEAVRRGGRD